MTQMDDFELEDNLDVEARLIESSPEITTNVDATISNKYKGHAWDMQEFETHREYKLFQEYLLMLNHADPRSTRNLATVARNNGYKDPNYVKRLSAENGWVERCRAYDEHVHSITVKKNAQAISDVQVAVQQKTMSRLVEFDEMLDKYTTRLKRRIEDDDVNGIEFQRVVNAMETSYRLKALILRMPLNIIADKVEQVDTDVFIIGGDE